MKSSKASRLALLYFLLAIGWVLLSDYIVEAFIPDPTQRATLRTLKDAAFVILMAGLLFLLLRREQTTQERTDAALRASEARYRALIEGSADGIVVIDAAGQVVYASPASTRILGYSPSELIKTPLQDLIHPDEVATVTNELAASPGATLQREVRVRAPHDGWRWVEVVATNVVEEPAVRGIIASFRDITPRKRSEEQIRFQANLLNTVGQGVVATSLDGKVLYWNRAAEGLYGWKAAETVGRNLFEVDPSISSVQQNNGLTEALKADQSWSEEIDVTHREGFTFPVLVTSSPIYDEEGTLIGVATVAQDITQRKRREREMESIIHVGATLRGARERTELLTLILDQLLDLLDAAGAMLVSSEPAMGAPHVEMARGEWIESEGLALSHEEGLTGDLLSTREPYLSNDVLADPRLSAASRELVGSLQSIICVPLITQEQSLGALWVGSRSAFTHADLHLLTAIAEMAANALHRTNLYEQTEHLLRLEQAARAEAERERQQIQELFDRDPAMMAITQGPEHVFQQANPTFLQAIGRSDVIGKRVRDVFPEWNGGGTLPILDQVYRSGEIFVGIEQLVPIDADHDGVLEDHYFNFVYQPLRNVYGDVNAIMIHAVDVTEQVVARLSLEEKTAQVERLNATLERRLQRAAALHRVSQMISSSVDLRVTMNVFLDQVISQLRVDAASALILNPHTLTLTYLGGRGFHDPAITQTELRLSESLAGQAALERRILVMPDVSQVEPESLNASFLQFMSDEKFSGYFAAPLLAKGEVKGVLELFNHSVSAAPDEEWLEFLQALATTGAIAVINAELFNNLQRSNLELALAYDATIEGWSHALDLRDKETEGHSQRVTEITMQLARAMGMPEAELIHIRRGALLHDIGKMGVPDAILLKPGPLTAEEWEIMRRHPVYGYELLAQVDFLRPALEVPYCHHEKWDGSGYPRGLKAEQIPLSARIFAVVDVWDALCSKRPYRPAWPMERARAHLQEQAGTHFDPRVVAAFLAMDPTRDGGEPNHVDL